MTERKTIEQYLGEWEVPGDMSIDAVVGSLRDFQFRYPDHTNLRLAVPRYYEYGDGFQVMGDRLENDEELHARLNKEAVALQKRLARAEKQRLKDEADYERLRKKLGR